MKSPINGKTVDLCAEYQREFDNCKNFRQEKKLILSLIGKTKFIWDNTTPAPVIFKWDSDEKNSLLEISENKSFENSYKYSVDGNSISVYNLKKDTEYFWRINGSEPESFITDSIMPRWLKINGLGNVRDLGGRKNCFGKRIKQGLIYRGVKLEDDITDTGIEQLRELGIRTELDLREESDINRKASLIGEDVKYIRIPCNGYDEFIRDDIDNGACKKLIEIFADSHNYPIYFHCAGGQDRTGTIAFFLNAILGLDDELLLREYELAMLSSPSQKISRSRKGKIKPFIKYLKKNGNRKATLSDNAVLFLKNAGVSTKTFNKIRDNLLEK